MSSECPVNFYFLFMPLGGLGRLGEARADLQIVQTLSGNLVINLKNCCETRCSYYLKYCINYTVDRDIIVSGLDPVLYAHILYYQEGNH
jgi:hypothetical protein